MLKAAVRLGTEDFAQRTVAAARRDFAVAVGLAADLNFAAVANVGTGVAVVAPAVLLAVASPVVQVADFVLGVSLEADTVVLAGAAGMAVVAVNMDCVLAERSVALLDEPVEATAPGPAARGAGAAVVG